jgi:hypothetical protein
VLVVGEEYRPLFREFLSKPEPLLVETPCPSRVSHPQIEVVEVHPAIVAYGRRTGLG